MNLIIAVLKEAWVHFGDCFPIWQQPEIARWVQERVKAIRNGEAELNPVAPTPRKPLPGWTPLADLIEREVGEEG